MNASRAEVRVVDDPGAEAARELVTAVEAGAQIALTGGSTPRQAYERAAQAPVDWAEATVWWGDERCVDPGDQRSNYAMAKAALLDRIPGAPPQVYRMKGELGAHEGAAAYERDLHDVLGAGMPELDLVLLGLGADGHCASLFPGQASLDEAERLAVGVEKAGLEPFVPRITLTLPVINATRRVVFLVSGADKAEAVARAFAGDPGAHTPASLVAPASGQLVVLLDAAAAGRLPEAGR